MTTQKTHLRNFNLEELKKFLHSMGTPSYQAAQIMDWLHRKHAMDFSEMSNLGKKWCGALARCAQAGTLTLREAPSSKRHETRKYLFGTEDQHLLESVLIQQSDRRTVCVSTQLGCRVRCVFCASGKGKFIRNLTAGEIVEQVSMVARHIKQPVTNVVFMGMGEPLDNYEATNRALEILTADWGFGLSGRRITVSTSGITPMIERFVRDFGGRVRLSVSLHSVHQPTRAKLVPIAKKYELKELIQTLEKIHKQLKREITFEYVLIEGINDAARDARNLAELAVTLNAKVNLIPYNAIREMDYKAPPPPVVDFFRKVLEEKQVRTTVRFTTGRDIHAACGQLRLDRSEF